jgi:hypothetical protein
MFAIPECRLNTTRTSVPRFLLFDADQLRRSALNFAVGRPPVAILMVAPLPIHGGYPQYICLPDTELADVPGGI